MSKILRLGIDDDDDCGFPTNNDDSEEQLSASTFSPLQKKEIELISIRVFGNLIQQTIEPLLRRIVKEEIGFMNQGTIDKRMRILQLHFLNKLDKQVLTGSKIEGKNGNSIQVALIDESTGKIVMSGPEASANVQIFVLESYQLLGEEDLNQKITKESETNKSLLHGNVFVYLNEGIGCINDLHFAHTSQWLKKRELMLVAKVISNCNGIRVKAAVMEPFTIKDRRNTLYLKHVIPTPSDDIWRLKNIIRGGPIDKRLRTNDINNVQTFLREFNLNPQRLLEVIGKDMSEKSFEDTVKHAQKCSFNKETYWYDGVVFNIIGEIIGLDFDGQFIAFDQLLDDNKAFARKSVLFAFNSKENLLVPYKEVSTQRLIPTPIHHHPLNGGMNEFYENENEEVDLSKYFVDDWIVNAGSNSNNTCYSIVVSSAHKRWKLLYDVSRFIFKRRNVSEFHDKAHKRQKMMIIC